MQRTAHIGLSIFILAVIGLHGLPIIHKLQGHTQTLWPILAWGMYKKSVSSDKPVQASIRRVFVKTSQGHETEIQPLDAGLSSYALERIYLTPIRQGDTGTVKKLAERLNRALRDNVIEVRLESDTYTITDSGLIKKQGPSVHYRIVN